MIRVSLTGGSADELWTRLSAQMTLAGLKLGDDFKAVGFPSDQLKAGWVTERLLDYDFTPPVVVVIDDFHLLDGGAVFSLIKRIALEQIKNFHIVLITRDFSKLDAAFLYQRGLCFTLTEKSLCFSKEEVRQYLELMDCTAGEEEVSRIFNLTGGWVSMIMLIVDGMRRGLPIEGNDTVEDIIEQNIYGLLGKSAQEALIKLSFLESFTFPMALHILGDHEEASLFMGLAHERSLIRYNELDKTYHIHNLLLDYISKKEDRWRIDAKEIYRRAGEWYLRQGQYSQAFDSLNRADATEAILAELNLEDRPELLFTPFQQFHKIFEDNSLYLNYPIAYLRCVYALALSGAPGAAAQCWDFMTRIENCVQCAALEENYKNFLLGEINALWAVITFNDLAKIIIHSRKSLSCFSGGCSRVVTRDKAFAYGSPHLLYLYYRELGGLRNTRDIFVDNRSILASSVSGYGIGCDSVAEAEYALETGAWDQVEEHAYKAIYKARDAGQTNLLVCANFTLARLALLRGNRDECLALMEALRKTLLNKNSPVLNTTFDLCMAYLSGCTVKLDGFPAWLSDGDWTGGYFYSQSQSFRAVARGMVLLREDPIHLEAYCETAVPEFQRYNNLLGLLHNAIHEAVARNTLHGKEAGLPALSAALSIGYADHVVAPFAENAPHILAMLEVLSQRGVKPEEAFLSPLNEQRPGAFLNEILDLCRRHAAGRNAGASDAMLLTAREIEILTLLESGLKHADIGTRLYISITTVRYHIQNIYQKLEVNNKTLAIRKAKSLGLI